MQGLSILIKPSSGNCNMRCGYCFYADVAGSRAEENRGFMRLDTLEALVKQAVAEVEGFVSFGFQGGEPTLCGLDFFEKLIEYQARYNTHGIEIANAIQTNGLLIDERWAAFFARNHFLVGLSIDGDKAVHDGLRLDAGGKETHSRCLKAARLLDRAGAEYNILCVLTRQFAQHPDRAYRFFSRNDLRYVQLIPCLDGFGEAPGAHPWSLDAQAFGRFLCRFFDLWYDDFMRGKYLSVRMFDNWIRMIAGQPPENCGMVGRCNSYPVVEADGTVYPCDFYVLDEYRLGRIGEETFTEMLDSDAARRFNAPSHTPHADCLTCPYGFICRGGCRRDRDVGAQDGLSLNRLCAGYRAFFDHALPRMREIARQVR